MPQRARLLLVALFVPLALQAQSALPPKHPPQPTVAAITAGDLATRLYIFSDDSMQGREAGTAGNVKGTAYIAAELKRLGLVPGGDDGTYFQTIPLKTRTLDTTSTLAVAGTPLKAFTDYLALGPEPLERSTLASVYGGELGDSAARLTPGLASGKLVVLRVPGGTSPRRMLRAVSVPGAAAVALGTAGASVASAVRFNVLALADPARNVVGIIPGSDPKLRGEYVAVGAHNDHLGFAHPPVDHDSIRIWNHVVRPEGADDAAKQATPEQQARVDSLLVLFRATHPGAARVDSVDNGADDDGSGSVAALEIAEHIASLSRKPKRSILFVWHTGEEKGLLGSRFFTDHPSVPRDSIVAQFNMDMVGRGSASDETGRTKEGVALHGGPRYLQLVGSRRLSTELGDLIERVNAQGGHGLSFDYAIDADGHPSNIYCRSDHYEYARYGIPITFFTTGLHSDYHQVTDEPQYIDYEHMARVATFVEDVVVHVANLDHRLVVDHPRPDPAAPCRQ